jgi:hypothetical protein
MGIHTCSLGAPILLEEARAADVRPIEHSQPSTPICDKLRTGGGGTRHGHGSTTSTRNGRSNSLSDTTRQLTPPGASPSPSFFHEPSGSGQGLRPCHRRRRQKVAPEPPLACGNSGAVTRRRSLFPVHPGTKRSESSPAPGSASSAARRSAWKFAGRGPRSCCCRSTRRTTSCPSSG